MKAAKWAGVLYSNTKDRTEKVKILLKKSEFEAEAYCEYLNGCSLFEKENWESALSHYIKGN